MQIPLRLKEKTGATIHIRYGVLRYELVCPDYRRQAEGRNEHFNSTCLPVYLPVYLPPVGEPADLPAEGMEAWRNGGRRHEI